MANKGNVPFFENLIVRICLGFCSMGQIRCLILGLLCKIFFQKILLIKKYIIKSLGLIHSVFLAKMGIRDYIYLFSSIFRYSPIWIIKPIFSPIHPKMVVKLTEA